MDSLYEYRSGIYSHHDIVATHNIKTVLNIMNHSSKSNDIMNALNSVATKPVKTTHNASKIIQENDIQKYPFLNLCIELCDSDSFNITNSYFQNMSKFRYKYIDIFNRKKDFFKKLRSVTKNKVLLKLQEIECDIDLPVFDAIATYCNVCFILHDNQFIYSNIYYFQDKEIFDQEESEVYRIWVTGKEYTISMLKDGIENASIVLSNLSRDRINVKNPCKLLYSMSVYSKAELIEICTNLKISIDTKMTKSQLYERFVSNINHGHFFSIQHS